MKVIKSIQAWCELRQQLPKQSIGFVPTMGNLHRGHVSLLTRSVADNDMTVLSLFVNPTQFNDRDDYKSYPKSDEADLAIAEESRVDYVLMPSVDDLYPDDYRYQIHESEFSKRMEGEMRAGHFTGMLTIVMKLLQIIQADNAYFGEKDYQQYLLIKGMAQAFFLRTQIKRCPTIREPSGLPFSSRLNRLNADQLKIAHEFARILHSGKPLESIKSRIQQLGIVIEYLQIFEKRCYVAVVLDGIRLIDNFIWESDDVAVS